MKLKEVYEISVKYGMENDPRGKKEVEKLLKKAKKAYDNLPEEEKKRV